MTALIARIAALKTTPTPDLQAQWRELFETEPPRRNRGYLESRIAYRIQELEHGGLSPTAIARLEALGETLDGGDATVRKRRVDDRPMPAPASSANTRASSTASRSWPTDSSTRAGPTSRSRPSPAPSPAPAGTGRSSLACGTREARDEQIPGTQVPLRGLYPQIERGRARHGVQLPRCPTRGLRGLYPEPLERPAIERLLADIEAGRIDIVVVYKIDRLSRSLMDFAKLVGVFETHGVTFVSITQQFNTTTPMGRLTLNILLSFAQFEREVTAERIRDKIAASRRKGMWMGGNPPLGYDVKDRKLVVNAEEAAVVREIFERFIACGSATALARTLRAEGVVTKRGRPMDTGTFYRLINNRVYIGEAVHKGSAYPGEHEAIVPRALWDKVHGILKESPRARANITRAQTPALLKGLVFSADGRRHDADPHPQARPALPLLCRRRSRQGRDPGRGGTPGAGGRDRGRRHP